MESRIRTTNVLERLFKEVKRRTRGVGVVFPNEAGTRMLDSGYIQQSAIGIHREKEKVRLAVFVFALGFVLALGVLFSVRNVGISQEVNGKKVNCVKEYPASDAPKKVQNIGWVCGIYGTKGTVAGWPFASIPDKIIGTNNDQIVDKIEGYAGNDKLYGRGGWNGLIGDTGKDTLVGGPSRDWILAVDCVDPEGVCSADSDVFNEVGPDTIRCGGGMDTVYADVEREGPPDYAVIFPVHWIDSIAKDCEKLEWGEPSIIAWFRETHKKRGKHNP